MRSPSPSDLCWVIGSTPQGRWIGPVVRAAIRSEWPGAKRLAARHLRDEALAFELMEDAIQQTMEYLEELPPISSEEARVILLRFYRNALRRRQYAGSKLRYFGSTSDLEPLAQPQAQPFPPVEAKLDIDLLLQETPLELREAMLLRYGARNRWKEVARELSKSRDAIRKSCQRELRRIRRKLGVQDLAE